MLLIHFKIVVVNKRKQAKISKRWSCRKPKTYTSINWTKSTTPIPRELSKNQCFMTSSTNFTFKDEKTSGNFENDLDTGSSLTIDKNVIG